MARVIKQVKIRNPNIECQAIINIEMDKKLYHKNVLNIIFIFSLQISKKPKEYNSGELNSDISNFSCSIIIIR